MVKLAKAWFRWCLLAEAAAAERCGDASLCELARVLRKMARDL